MRTIELVIFVATSIIAFALGTLFFFGWQVGGITSGDSSLTIDSLIGALEQGKVISNSDLVALLKLYAKEAKSGLEVIVTYTELMHFAGVLLLTLSFVQLVFLFKIARRQRSVGTSGKS
jgi:hypothetical protein